jgi:hypothetical protein
MMRNGDNQVNFHVRSQKNKVWSNYDWLETEILPELFILWIAVSWITLVSIRSIHQPYIL